MQSITEWDWEITTRCNLFCKHCLLDAGEPRKNELDTASVIEATKTIALLGGKLIKFTGGEPLTRSDIFLIFKTCKQYGLKMQLLTNGTLINKENVSQIVNLIDAIGISIDGSTPEIHEALRGKNSYSKTLNAFRLLRNVLPVSAFIAVSAINIQSIDSIITKLHSLGVYDIRINDVTMAGRANQYKAELQISDQQQKDLKKDILQTLNKFYETELITENSNCDLDLSTAYLASDGYLYLCSEIALSAPRQNIGNILDGNIRKKLEQIQRQLTTTNQDCCYEFIVGDGFSLCLNRNRICPFVESGENYG